MTFICSILKIKNGSTRQANATGNLNKSCAGQFLSRGFVVLLRKNIPQNHDLKTAAELGVKRLP